MAGKDSHEKQNGSRATERLLIVDDEPYVCQVLTRWLKADDYTCQTANSVEEAWKLLEDGKFSLVLSDIMMPGKTGIDLLRLIKDKFPDVAVVMVTGVDDRTMAITALELGAYGYLIKPFDRNEVVINVVNALERRRLELACLAQLR